MQTSFGEYLKDKRINKGLSLRKLGEMSEISHSYLSQVEHNKRGIPSPEILRKLSKPLGVSYQELMRAANYMLPLVNNRFKIHINEDQQAKLKKTINNNDNFYYAFNCSKRWGSITIGPAKRSSYLYMEVQIFSDDVFLEKWFSKQCFYIEKANFSDTFYGDYIFFLPNGERLFVQIEEN